MANVIEPLLNRTVSVITSDGRVILGILKGFDQSVNLVLDDSFERVFTLNGVEQVNLGVYIIRGDNVALLGEIDDEYDKSIDFSRIRADPLNQIVH